ncbi:MAG TPA: FAD-dependent monooxygenase, partial [Gemmatirosa sp.]
MGAPKGNGGTTVLVAGAGFAGLASAYWMNQLGYDVTVAEAAPGIRTGGTAVNIRGATIDVVKRMGIFDEVRANRLSLKRWDFKTADDRTVRSLELRADGEPPPDDDYEIERDVLMRILLDTVRGRCEIRFGDRVVGLRHAEGGETDRVDVVFKTAAGRAFDLVLGCDGTHSGVRRLWFGEESQYVHDLQQYFSVTIADKLLIERDTAQLYNEPGKAVMLNAYKDR